MGMTEFVSNTHEVEKDKQVSSLPKLDIAQFRYVNIRYKSITNFKKMPWYNSVKT